MYSTPQYVVCCCVFAKHLFNYIFRLLKVAVYPGSITIETATNEVPNLVRLLVANTDAVDAAGGIVELTLKHKLDPK